MPGAHDVRSWKRIDPATLSLDQEFSFNYSACMWSVGVRDGVPTATEQQPPTLDLPPGFHLPHGMDSPPRVARQGQAGVLLGYNHGEWGGSLLWCSLDGTVRRELLDDNVVAVVPNADRFVVLAGLSHQGLDQGRVLELVDAADGFYAARTTELGRAPTAAVVEPSGAVLVTTTHGLVRLTPEFHVHRLRDFHWQMFYPTSIVVVHATAYVGMRGIVGEIKLDTDPPQATWLFPI